MLIGPPLKSETGWTGELWLNPVLLILKNLDDSIFSYRQKKIFSKQKINKKNMILEFFDLKKNG